MERSAPAASGTPRTDRRIRALILLGGSVRASDLFRSIQRSPLDLPVESGRSVIAYWAEHAADLARGLGIAELPVRVIIDKGGVKPIPPKPDPLAPFRIEEEQGSFRGTGGILRDATAAYDPEDLVLVANAAQVLVEPLTSKVQDLLATAAAVSLIAHGDGSPAGLFLIRCAALRAIKDVGFVDFKEQVLPKLVQSLEVRAVPRARATAMPIRTREAYLDALRYCARLRAGNAADAEDPFAEDWSSTFTVAEPGASVAPGARLHDSVVLDGGVVEDGAAAVRCVVCAGGIVRAGQTVADQVVTGARTRGGRP